MHNPGLALPRSIDATGLAGFPARLTTVVQARDAVAAARLPLVRSHYRWLHAYNRLTLAQTNANTHHVEAAFIALSQAVAAEKIAGPDSSRPLAA